ncbi:glycosyltransferase family protein [Arthrobacter sp. TMT4-20]
MEHFEVPRNLERLRTGSVNLGLLLGARFHERLYFDSERVKLVRRLVPAGSVDVVVANDALAVPLAVALRPRLGVHADLHEYAPRQGEDKIVWRLLIGPMMNWACRKYVTKADSVTTVAKGIAEEYAKVYGIPEPGVVKNASPYDPRFSPTPVKLPLRLVHAGAAGRSRRIEVMMEAVKRANEIKPGTATFDVVLVPGEQKYIDELTALADSIPNNAVRVLPPVSFDQIVPFLHGYDVGFYLCPPLNFNMRHALPNKLFEFVQARLALLIGPSTEMAGIVNQYGIGIVAEDFDAETSAKLLVAATAEEIAAMKQASHENAEILGAANESIIWAKAVKKLSGIA